MKYRYVRHIRIGNGPSICFIALAPLAIADSQTMRRYERWSMAWGYGSIAAVNVHPFITTAALDGLAAWVFDQDRIATEHNVIQVLETAQACATRVACWGGSKLARMSPVPGVLSAEGITLKCLGYNADGSPKHPSGRGLPSVPALLTWEMTQSPSCNHNE